MSALQFLVGDQYGRILAELTPGIEEISWRLSDVGQVKFSLSSSDPKRTEANLQFGNRVLIQFDNGLPAWGGIIDPPRDWVTGMVTCTAYSAEHIFNFRATGKSALYNGSTIGEIYQTLIENANSYYYMGIDLGSISMVGSTYTKEYHYTNMMSIFREYLTDELSDYDFDVTAAESLGYIVFYANLYQRKGQDKSSQYALVEGQNMEVTRFGQQGQIVNVWYVAGKGNDWGDERLVGYAQDVTSLSRYGRRVSSAVRSDTDEQVELDALAAVALAESKDPHNMIEIQTSNNPPAEFADYGVGDSLRIISASVGFEGLDTTARVIARSYDPNSGLCQLVMREDV